MLRFSLNDGVEPPPFALVSPEVKSAMPNALARKLGQVAKLSNTDKKALESALSGRLRNIGPREDVIREGDRPHAVNVFLCGWAWRYNMLEAGRRQLIAFFVPGDFCDLNVFI